MRASCRRGMGAMLAALALLLPYAKDAWAGEELMVSAAMSLNGAFEEMAAIYEAGHPGVDVVLNFSSSGRLRGQIEAGAPVDVFASADGRDMDILAGAGLIDAKSRRDFAVGELVLAAPIGGGLSGFEGLAAPNVRRIAMANPSTSPAGRYAKQALERMGLWGRVENRLVYAETVRQVLDYLVRGEADAGLLYASDVALRADVSAVAVAPEGSHERIAYPIAAVNGAARAGDAMGFIDLATSARGRAVLAKGGFGAP